MAETELSLEGLYRSLKPPIENMVVVVAFAFGVLVGMIVMGMLLACRGRGQSVAASPPKTTSSAWRKNGKLERTCMLHAFEKCGNLKDPILTSIEDYELKT